jgi:DNA-binding transcriptional LysR family regulator
VLFHSVPQDDDHSGAFIMQQLSADSSANGCAAKRSMSSVTATARVSIGTLDLNLLKVLDAIMEERNLTRAGQRLRLSQPATSHALARLRYMLADELFVRTPEGMQPTPRAEQIAQPIREALRVLTATLEPRHFDPAESSRSFTLLASNYAARAVVPPLSRMIAEAAPGVSLDIRPVGMRNVLDQLDAGAADVALTKLVEGGERFKCVRIADDDFVALLDRQHPQANLPGLTAECLAAIPHVAVTSSDDHTGFVDDALGALGLTRTIAARVPFLSIVLMLMGADRLTIVPRRAAIGLTVVCPLVMKELPFPSPRTELSMIWHRGLDKDPAQQWLRSMVRASVQD